MTILLLLMAPPAEPSAADDSCTTDGARQREIARLLESWERVRREALRLPPSDLPRILFFDSRCLWEVRRAAATAGPETSAGGPTVPLAAQGHDGSITLPGGERIPAGLTPFASAEGDPPQPYMVMPLTSIWRAEPRHATEADLESLVRAVFIHEMTHTAHAAAHGRAIDALVETHGLGDEIDDDIVQARFGDVAEHRRLWERERDLLFLAAGEVDAERRAILVRRAISARSVRHQRFLSGDLAFHRELETIFLDMEGVAQWAAFRSLELEGVEREQAIERVRGRRHRWSQDEGFGLYLALDAVVPGWQEQVFRDPPISAWDLLARSVGGT